MATADIYRRSRTALSELAREFDAAQLAVVVRETPEWTVRDVLGHLVGGAEDHVTGSNEGAPGAEWTAAHVARLASLDVDELLGLWAEVGPGVEQFLVDDPRAWSAVAIDVWCHEHDVRAAVGAPRRDDPEAVEFVASAVRSVRRRCEAAGLPVPEVVVAGGVVLDGDGPTVEFPDLYELGRVVLGRRSAGQIRALPWSADPEPYVPVLSVFPLPDRDLHG